MKELKDKVKDLELAHGQEVVEARMAEYDEKRKTHALKLIGALTAADSIKRTFSKALAAQVMNGWIKFQQEELYREFGHSNFAEFLDHSEHSPMSKHQFYERKQLFEAEGEEIFDLLNEVGMSFRKRRLLGQGNIQLEGEMVIVRDGDEETEIELNDRTRLLETLTALADRNYLQQRKIDKQDEAIGKLTEKTQELKAETERVLAMKKSDLADPHAVAILQLTTSLKDLVSEIDELTPAEREFQAPQTLELLAQWRERLQDAYGKRVPYPKEPLADDDEMGKLIRDNFNDEELEELVGGP